MALSNQWACYLPILKENMMRTTILRGLCAIGLLAMLLGIYLPANAAPQSAPLAQRAIRIRIFDNGFGPDNVTVAAGTTVTWVNSGRAPHNVVASNGSFESPVLRTGESFSYTFSNVGGFGYRCTIHENMEGNIEVTAQVEPTTVPATATRVPATPTSVPATATRVPATPTSVPAATTVSGATATTMMMEPSATAMMMEPGATTMMMTSTATTMMMKPSATTMVSGATAPTKVSRPGLPRTGQPTDSPLSWLLVAAMLLLTGSGLLARVLVNRRS